MLGGGGPAGYGLNEVRGVPACREGAARDGGEVVCRPGGLFAGFEENGGAGEEGGDYGAEEVVELGRLVLVRGVWRRGAFLRDSLGVSVIAINKYRAQILTSSSHKPLLHPEAHSVLRWLYTSSRNS